MSAQPLELELAPAARAALLPLPQLSRTIGPYERWVKPGIDIFVGLCAAVVLLPLIVLTALVVLVEFGRPVFFRQSRVGRDGRIFTVYKFRTMERCRRGPGADRPVDLHDRRRTHKSSDDPRHTRLGQLLRKCSVDELPQLWNVLRGDMSLVGPRPELVEVVERYQPWQRRRHEVKPGVTGLWQVSARGQQPMHELTHIDLAYIDRLSLATDLRILLGTPTALVRRQGS